MSVYRVYVLFFFFFKQKTAYEMLRSLVGSEMCIRDRAYAQGQYPEDYGYIIMDRMIIGQPLTLAHALLRLSLIHI